MSQVETTQVEAVRSMTNKEMVLAILSLQAQVAELQAKTTPKTSDKEMTDDDARSILIGEHASKKHKDAASALGLTYGQVYSCRLGYTFKTIHKEVFSSANPNPWIKA